MNTPIAQLFNQGFQDTRGKPRDPVDPLQQQNLRSQIEARQSKLVMDRYQRAAAGDRTVQLPPGVTWDEGREIGQNLEGDDLKSRRFRFDNVRNKDGTISVMRFDTATGQLSDVSGVDRVVEGQSSEQKGLTSAHVSDTEYRNDTLRNQNNFQSIASHISSLSQQFDDMEGKVLNPFLEGIPGIGDQLQRLAGTGDESAFADTIQSFLNLDVFGVIRALYPASDADFRKAQETFTLAKWKQDPDTFRKKLMDVWDGSMERVVTTLNTAWRYDQRLPENTQESDHLHRMLVDIREANQYDAKRPIKPLKAYAIEIAWARKGTLPDDPEKQAYIREALEALREAAQGGDTRAARELERLKKANKNAYGQPSQ